MMPAAAAVSDSQVPVESPFRFLDYFRKDDWRVFAGREEEVLEILPLISKARTFLLYGRSGLGKTSLIFAGLFRPLAERGYRPVYLRVFDAPVRDVCEIIAAEADVPGLSREGLPEALRKLSGGAPLVLVFDQFEEFFIRLRERKEERQRIVEQRQEFADLLQVLSQLPGVRVFFSLREDYLAEMRDLEPWLPGVTENAYRLQALTAFGARQGIRSPLVKANIPFEDALLNHLVDELAAFDFDPPILQIACTEIFREASKRGAPLTLTRDDYDRVGGIDGIFHRYVDGLSRRFPEEKHLLVRSILDAMLTHERTKKPVRVADLVRTDAGEPAPRTSTSLRAPRAQVHLRADEHEVKEVLNGLARLSLVREVNRAGVMWYELLHDRLVEVVEEWLERDTTFVQFRNLRGFLGALTGTDSTAPLLSEPQLRSLIMPLKERLILGERECEFVFRSSVAENSDVAFWAARLDELGAGRSAAVVAQMLGAADPKLRIGAARAAAVVGDPQRQLPGKCLGIGLDDEDESVRDAAGATLVQIAGAPEWETIKDALAKKHPRAIEVLSYFYPGRPMPKDGRWSWRLRARLQAEKRAARQHRDVIDRRGNIGLLVGLLAGLTWAMSLGLFTAFVMSSLEVSSGIVDAWTSELARHMLPMIIVGLGGSLALAAWSGRSAARLVALDDALLGRWRRRPRVGWAADVFAPASAIFFLYLLAGKDMGLGESALLAGICVPPILLGHYVMGPIVGFALSTFGRGSRTLGFALVSLVSAATLGIAFILIVLALTMVGFVNRQVIINSTGIAILVGGMGLFATFFAASLQAVVNATAIVVSRARVPIVRAPAAGPTLARRIALGLTAVATWGVSLAVVSPHILPVFPARIAVKPGDNDTYRRDALLDEFFAISAPPLSIVDLSPFFGETSSSNHLMAVGQPIYVHLASKAPGRDEATSVNYHVRSLDDVGHLAWPAGGVVALDITPQLDGHRMGVRAGGVLPAALCDGHLKLAATPQFIYKAGLKSTRIVDTGGNVLAVNPAFVRLGDSKSAWTTQTLDAGHCSWSFEYPIELFDTPVSSRDYDFLTGAKLIVTLKLVSDAASKY